MSWKLKKYNNENMVFGRKISQDTWRGICMIECTKLKRSTVKEELGVLRENVPEM